MSRNSQSGPGTPLAHEELALIESISARLTELSTHDSHESHETHPEEAEHDFPPHIIHQESPPQVSPDIASEIAEIAGSESIDVIEQPQSSEPIPDDADDAGAPLVTADGPPPDITRLYSTSSGDVIEESVSDEINRELIHDHHHITINTSEIIPVTGPPTSGSPGDDDPDSSSSTSAYDENDFPIFKPISGPYPLSTYLKDWKQVKNEILSGIVVSFAQVPESVAFAFLAGTEPLVGLHAAWMVGLFISLTGARPGLINGATGAKAAILMAPVAEYGEAYIFPIVILAGVLQVVFSLFNIAKLKLLIPTTAEIGFVNGLAIIIAREQLHNFNDQSGHGHGFVTGGKLGLMIMMAICTFCIVEFLPRLTRMVPSSLVGLAFAMFLEHGIIRTTSDFRTTTIDDISKIKGGLPKWVFTDDTYDLPGWGDLDKIIGPAFWAAVVSIIEAVLTIEVVNDLTDTRSDNQAKDDMHQLISQGLANVLGGVFGTMGGGPMIGLSIINCHSGSNGRYRISGVVAAICVLLMILVGSPIISAVPAAALVGIMGVVVYHTFEWSSLLILLVTLMPASVRHFVSDRLVGTRYENMHRKIGRMDAIVIIGVTVLTLVTNLAIAVVLGIVFTGCVYAWESAHRIEVLSQIVKFDDGNKEDLKIYHIEGSLFFGNAQLLAKQFDVKNDPNEIEIHLRDASIYDYSAIQALNFVGEKYKKVGKSVHLKHLCISSSRLIGKAKHLCQHFTYETVQTLEDHGVVELDENPLHLHVQHFDGAPVG